MVRAILLARCAGEAAGCEDWTVIVVVCMDLSGVSCIDVCNARGGNSVEIGRAYTSLAQQSQPPVRALDCKVHRHAMPECVAVNESCTCEL